MNTTHFRIFFYELPRAVRHGICYSFLDKYVNITSVSASDFKIAYWLKCHVKWLCLASCHTDPSLKAHLCWNVSGCSWSPRLLPECVSGRSPCCHGCHLEAHASESPGQKCNLIRCLLLLVYQHTALQTQGGPALFLRCATMHQAKHPWEPFHNFYNFPLSKLLNFRFTKNSICCVYFCHLGLLCIATFMTDQSENIWYILRV